MLPKGRKRESVQSEPNSVIESMTSPEDRHSKVSSSSHEKTHTNWNKATECVEDISKFSPKDGSPVENLREESLLYVYNQTQNIAGNLQDLHESFKTLAISANQELLELDNELGFVEKKIAGIIHTLFEDYKRDFKSQLHMKTKVIDLFLKNTSAEKGLLKKIDNQLSKNISLIISKLTKEEFDDFLQGHEAVFEIIRVQAENMEVLNTNIMNQKIAYFLKNTSSFTESLRLVLNEGFKSDETEYLRTKLEFLKNHNQFLTAFTEQSNIIWEKLHTNTSTRNKTFNSELINTFSSQFLDGFKLTTPNLRSHSNSRAFFSKIKTSNDFTNQIDIEQIEKSERPHKIVTNIKTEPSKPIQSSHQTQQTVPSRALPRKLPQNPTSNNNISVDVPEIHPTRLLTKKVSQQVHATTSEPETSRYSKLTREEKIKNMFHKILESNEVQIYNAKNFEPGMATSRVAVPKMERTLPDTRPKTKPITRNEKAVESKKTPFNQMSIEKLAQSEARVDNQNSITNFNTVSKRESKKPEVKEVPNSNEGKNARSRINPSNSVKKQTFSQDLKKHTMGNTDRFKTNQTKNIYEWHANRFNSKISLDF